MRFQLAAAENNEVWRRQEAFILSARESARLWNQVSAAKYDKENRPTDEALKKPSISNKLCLILFFCPTWPLIDECRSVVKLILYMPSYVVTPLIKYGNCHLLSFNFTTASCTQRYCTMLYFLPPSRVGTSTSMRSHRCD